MNKSVPHKYPSRTFRPWPENQSQFDFAERQKFNVSELINEIVAKHFKRHIALKTSATAREFVRQFGNGQARTTKSPPKLNKTRH